MIWHLAMGKNHVVKVGRSLCTNAASEQFSADKVPKKFFFITNERVQDIQGLRLEPYTEQHIEGYMYIFDRKGNFLRQMVCNFPR